MRLRLKISLIGIAVMSSTVMNSSYAQTPKPRLNPVIGLLEANKPVFGLYAPSNRPPGGPQAATTTQGPQKSPLELAKEAVAYKSSDYVFDGAMEHDYAKSYPQFATFAAALKEAGPLSLKPSPHLSHPMIVKMAKIGSDTATARTRIGQQLDLGVSGIMFVETESAEEVKSGIAAMRFKANGGTRTDSVGTAPAFWGLSEKEYRQKADVWPLNPQGELINWTIIETKEGLKHVREIAAVKGIGVLWPGAGSLRGVFSTTGADGKRVVDEQAWEAAIQQVLAACKEFKVPCGYPASADNIEMRMKQGFSVFVMGWGEPGFKAVEMGRKASNRPATNE